jgi:division protein CdvB (Snf7/Vps24/ESCRT-III family)
MYKTMPGDIEDDNDEAPTEETVELMESHDLTKDEAEHVQEIMDEYGVDEDEAVEIAEVE